MHTTLHVTIRLYMYMYLAYKKHEAHNIYYTIANFYIYCSVNSLRIFLLQDFRFVCLFYIL
jgi:heme/copper-type cytochrome/quinol oxidase subunit 4